MHGDHIQVTFHDHHLVGGADRFAGAIQAVQQAALVEQHSLRRIHELGDVVRVKDAPAKTGHPAVFIADGDHDAVAELVIMPAGIALGQQTDIHQFLFAVFFSPEMG